MSVVSQTVVQLREARFQDYPAIAALEATQGLASKPFDAWRRLWAGNPCYQELGPRWPIGWVLENKERVVGCLCNVPLPYVLEGEKLLVAAGHGWAVEEHYRTYALMLMDEYFNQPNVDLFLNTTVNAQAAEAFGTFGSLRVPAGDWASAAFAVTAHRGFAESALRVKRVPLARLISYPAGFGLALKDTITRRRIPKARIEVTPLAGFDARFDTFWETSSKQSRTLLGVRTREVLQWHFGTFLEQGKLWIMSASRGGAMEAFAIFQRRDEPQYGLTRTRMVDFQALDQHDQYCAAMMKCAYDQCRAQGIQVLEQVGCGLARTRIFERCAPYRRQLPAWSFYYLTKKLALQQRLSEAASWEPSSYDGDSSL